MKILFVTTASSTAYAFLLDLAHYLRSQGFNVEFACSNMNYSDAKSRVHELEVDGFTVHNIPFSRPISPIKDLISLFNLCALLRDNNYDILHVHTSKASWIGRIAGRLSRVPLIVYTAHDFYFRSFKGGYKRNFYIILEKIASPFSDVTLFVSEAVKTEAIKEHIFKSDNLVWVGNGIRCDKFEINATYRNTMSLKYGISSHAPIIGVVARLVKNKGIDLFIKAASVISNIYKNAKFIICGYGPEEENLRTLTKELNISDKVIFTGRIESKEELNHIMASFSIFLFPTRREGLGIVYLEAMVLGIPVVGTRIPPVTEIIIDGQTGLLADTEDYNAFALSAISLLTDHDLSKRLVDAAQKRVWEYFNLPIINQRTKSAYYSAIMTTKSAKKLVKYIDLTYIDKCTKIL